MKRCSIYEHTRTRYTPLKGFIKAQEDSLSFQDIDGLTMVEPELGATTWRIVSSPTPLYQHYFKFHYDAFCILSVKTKIDDATIKLFSRDVRDPQAPFKQTLYSFLLGQPLQEGQLPDIKGTLQFCTTLDQSKGTKGIGLPMKTGMSLCINNQNQQGGLHSKRISLMVRDDEHSPITARKNVEQCVADDKSNFILCPVGASTLESIVDLIEQKKIVVLFPQSGATQFRKPSLTNIVHFKASLEDEGRVLTHHMLNRYNLKNFLFFYQDDSFGLNIIQGARQVLKAAGVPQAHEISYAANTTYFKDAAEKIKKANPDVIGFFATGPATLQLIRALGIDFLATKQLYGVSALADAVTLKVFNTKGLKITLGRLVPNPRTSSKQIVRDYREQLYRAYKKEKTPNSFSLEAYIGTSIALDLMSKIPGPLTQQALLEQIESVKEYMFKGLKLNFNPRTRSLGNYMWISTPENEWFEVSTDTLERNEPKDQ
jgi:branched-chain amino acid transport system substrate-binding protein